MLTEFKIPELGENIVSGTVVKVLVKSGDTVKDGQDLLELETDKATLPVPSNISGTVKEVLIKAGDEARVGQTVIKIATAKGAQPAAAAKTQQQQPAKASSTSSPAPAARPAVTAPAQAPILIRSARPAKDVPAAPSVRRFARELGLDVSLVPGSGRGGRITNEDIKAYVKAIMTSDGMMMGMPQAPAGKPLPDFSKWGSVERQPMSKIRSVTAEHLSYCWQTIPHVTQFGKADITELEKLRKQTSTPENKLTITPFLLKIMTAAMKQFPQFSASINMETKEIIYKKYIHIGVAVDTDHGLLVPVIRDVDQKSILQIHQEVTTLAQKARDRKVSLDDLKGGCMSLTNLGGIGGTAFTPIVNWPEVAILGVSRGAMEQVYNGKEFVPRMMLPLSLSYDHRLIDGADGARFLRWVCEAIEKPSKLELGK